MQTIRVFFCRSQCCHSFFSARFHCRRRPGRSGWRVFFSPSSCSILFKCSVSARSDDDSEVRRGFFSANGKQARDAERAPMRPTRTRALTRARTDAGGLRDSADDSGIGPLENRLICLDSCPLDGKCPSYSLGPLRRSAGLSLFDTRLYSIFRVRYRLSARLDAA